MNRRKRDRFYAELDVYLSFFAEVYPEPMLADYPQRNRSKELREKLSWYGYSYQGK